MAANIERTHEKPSNMEILPCQSAECSLETDLVLRSSDGVLYSAHSQNLHTYSEGFPPSCFASDSLEIVQMSEPSTILALLLQYMHNARQPDSRQLDFDTLVGIAEAVEKYMVYSAMEVCKIRMELSIPQDPLMVLAYAIKHGYSDLQDAAVPLTISAPFQHVEEVLQELPHALIAWIKYRHGFIQALSSLFKRPPVVPHRNGASTCLAWAAFQRAILKLFDNGIDSLEYLRNFSEHIEAEIHRLVDCPYCNQRARLWCRAVQNTLCLLPAFSCFL